MFPKKENILIYIIAICRVSAGLYSRFTSNYVALFITWLYCVCSGLVLTYYVVIYFLQLNISLLNMVGLSAAFEYDIILVTSLLSGSEHFFEFIKKLKCIDRSFGLMLRVIEVPYTFAIFLICIMFNIVNILYFLTINYHLATTAIQKITHIFVANVLHFSYFLRIMMFEMLWWRVKFLHKSIIATNFHNNPSTLKIKKIQNVLLIYNALRDHMRSIRFSTNLLIVLSAIKILPHLLVVMILLAKTNNVTLDSILGTLIYFILPCAPALFAELIKSEVEKIRTILTSQLYVNKDVRVRNKLRDAIEFIDLCPFRYVVWRTIPMDISFPMKYISFVTTFVIVTLQFMHVLD